MSQRITEAQTLHVTEAATPGRVMLQLITPGWGSSGYYSPQVLENAATEGVFPAGTHAYFDHPSESERHDRPERSVRDLVMVLAEDAHVDDAGGLVAEAKVIGPYRELVTDPVFMESVGMSIRAAADTTIGEAEGRKGTIVTQLVEGVSVDLVTHAGRGGRILAAVESARAELAEATTDEVRTALEAAVFEHAPDDAYLVDFDPDQGVAYVRTFGEGPDGMYAHPYTYTAPTAVIDWTDATPVRRVVRFVPTAPTDGGGTSVPAPAGQSTATESQGDDMATTQIEESQLAALRQDAERVPTLESERDTAQRELAEAREALARRDRDDAITRVVESVEGHDILNRHERRGIAAEHAEGDLDEDALRQAVEAAVAERAAQSGAGSITGFGTTHTSDSDVVREAETAAAGAFGRTIKEA